MQTNSYAQKINHIADFVKADEPQFVSGFGKYHGKNRGGYSTITYPEIVSMAEDPPSTPKDKAQWIIPSELQSRVHAQQRQNGVFRLLIYDEDKNAEIDFNEFVGRAGGIIGSDFLAYASRSATKTHQKAHLIAPLASPLTGHEYSIVQKVMNDQFEAAGIIPDREMEAPGQVCYLPNKGEFYAHQVVDWLGPLDPYQVWGDEIKGEHERLRLEAEDRQARSEEADRRTAKRLADGKGLSPIEAFNAEHPIELMLEGYGYTRRGDRWLSPNSESGSPGVSLTDDKAKWLSAHGSDAAIGIKTDNGTMGDAFDLFVHYEFNGNREAATEAIIKKSQRDFMQKKSQVTDEDFEGVDPSPEARELAREIESRIFSALNTPTTDRPALKEALAVKPIIIHRMIRGAFWSGQKSKLFLLNGHDSLNQYAGKEGFKFLEKRFGRPVSLVELNRLVDEAEIPGKGNKTGFRKTLLSIHKTVIMDYLKFHNQRDTVEWRVDIFATRSRMEFMEDGVRVILKHHPFKCDYPTWNPKIVDDFKDHFPRFDTLLDFIVHSRFVLDRKKAYLWIKAPSDWAKGFLLGVLRELKCSIEISIKEIEAMLEGQPAGRSPKDFKRAFVLAVDEFKTVKSELKQLQSEITLAPKNQLVCSVEIFAKLFLSAESVPSLVTESGVEDQFCNRISFFDEKGSLVNRPLYKEVQNPAYFQSIVAYTVEKLNVKVDQLRQLGKMQAQMAAEQWLDDFIGRYGLDQYYQRYSDSLPELAERIIRYWKSWSNQSGEDRILNTKDGVFVTSPAKMLEQFFEQHFDKSQIPSLRKKREELFVLLSEDGKGIITHRTVGVKPIWGIKLKDVDEDVDVDVVF